MDFLFLGFFTGLSLILAIGAQNIFVIEQGLKKQFIFTVCIICALSDFLLIFLGIFLFHHFEIFFTSSVELILNILLLIFLLHFIWNKIQIQKSVIKLDKKIKKISYFKIIFRTLGFTYLNPHVYSDTVFFLGNFSKNFSINDKYMFGIGASISSIIFFFIIGYLSKYLSNYLKSKEIWNIINTIIILFMCFLTFYVLTSILK
tara:strand:+ start:432 stop:1040 length:609 start_codon:yes stop_codon:yes gene_type:complete